MFPTSKLLNNVQCPDRTTCKLTNCPYSHAPPRKLPGVKATNPTTASTTSSSSAVPAKRSKSNSSTSDSGAPLSKRPQPSIIRQPVASVSTSSTTPSSKSAANGLPSSSSASSASTLRQAGLNLSGQSSEPVASTSAAANSSTSGSGPSRPLPAIFLTPLVDTGPPRISPSAKGHTPPSVRQKLLTAIYDQFLLSYANLPDKARAKTLASLHAKEQEETILSRSNKATYRNSVISSLARLKKRPPITSEDETGTLEQEAERNKKREEAEKGKLTRERVRKYVSTRETLKKYDYIVDVPEGEGGDQPTEEGNVRMCDRCGTEFIVTPLALEQENTKAACSYHWGRMVTEKQGGIKQRVFSCCLAPNAPPCQQGPHVFRDKDVAKLHARITFVPTASITSSSTPKLDIVALDCELVYTTSGMALARLTVVDHDGKVILDEHVRPQGTVLDLNTRFSGVKEEHVAEATLDVKAVREALGQFVNEKTIMVGHGLENDLSALRIVHPTVIDTAIIFPHPQGIPFRHALRNLTRDHLGLFIQDGGAAKGHSAVEDSRAALELVRFKMKQDAARG